MNRSPETPLDDTEDPEIVKARKIPQVFMNPEVRAAIEDGQTANLTKKNVPCGILVTFKNVESGLD
jgi:hypothetical protein